MEAHALRSGENRREGREANDAHPEAVYIHIPFCTNKCHYCDFTAYVVKGQPVDEYLRRWRGRWRGRCGRCPPDESDPSFSAAERRRC